MRRPAHSIFFMQLNHDHGKSICTRSSHQSARGRRKFYAGGRDKVASMFFGITLYANREKNSNHTLDRTHALATNADMEVKDGDPTALIRSKSGWGATEEVEACHAPVLVRNTWTL